MEGYNKDRAVGCQCRKLQFFSRQDLSDNTFTIRYEDTQKNAVPTIQYDGVPFLIRGKRTLECHQGKDRSKKKKERAQLLRNQETDHDYRKKRKHFQTTKKKDCPAMIKIRHLVKFTDFKLEDNTPYGRDRMSAQIHDAVDKKNNLNIEHVYLIFLPDVSSHQNHFTGEIGMLIQPLDERIKKYIKKIVAESNITSSTQMKLLLDIYVKNYLFKDKQLPSPINSRFWPTLKVIRNNILLGLLEIRNSNVDQKIVEQKIDEWKSQYPADDFLLRKKEEQESFEPTTPAAIPDDDSEGYFNDEMASLYCGNREKFLYIHQTPWQRRLLARYGNEIALLDATYRTTKYALPLYFLCVPTNVNYITVASFVLETEDCTSIKEALNIIKHWNPEWKPSFFMADYCDEEITALEDVFPGMNQADTIY